MFSVSQSVSQLFPKKIEGNAQSPRAARRDRSQPLGTGTSVLQTLQSRRAPSPSPGQTILAHLKCTSHNHRHEVYTDPLTQEKPLSQGCTQKTSCVPQGISHPPSSQESLAATTRVAAPGHSSLVEQIAAIAIKKHSFSTALHKAEQEKKASAHNSSSE